MRDKGVALSMREGQIRNNNFGTDSWSFGGGGTEDEKTKSQRKKSLHTTMTNRVLRELDRRKQEQYFATNQMI